MKGCYTSFSHEERFPQDFFAALGTILHNIIKYLITAHFWRKNSKAYSEIIVDFNTRVLIDNFFLNVKSHNYLYKVLECNRYLVKEMHLDIDETRNINGFMFDYTNDVSEKNIRKKGKKYQKKDKLLFIVGTRWPRKYKKRIIETSFKNIRIIKHDLFAEFIGIDGKILDIFNYAIGLNYIFDLNALKETLMGIENNFLKKFGRDLFKNDDLKKDLEKKGIRYDDFF